MRARLRWVLLGAMGLLFLLSIPWYRSSLPAEGGIWLGLPDWVSTALLCYVGVALLNALAWLWTEILDPPRAEETGPEAKAGGEG